MFSNVFCACVRVQVVKRVHKACSDAAVDRFVQHAGEALEAPLMPLLLLLDLLLDLARATGFVTRAVQGFHCKPFVCTKPHEFVALGQDLQLNSCPAPTLPSSPREGAWAMA